MESICEKSFQLSHVKKSLINQVFILYNLIIFIGNFFCYILNYLKVDRLIDVCLQYNVLPRIDFSKNMLTLRGDYESCLHCFVNLQDETPFHKYTISFTNPHTKEDIIFNTYDSLRIDEAFANDESNVNIMFVYLYHNYFSQAKQISITSGYSEIFDIDLKALKVFIRGNTQTARLRKEQLNGR